MCRHAPQVSVVKHPQVSVVKQVLSTRKASKRVLVPHYLLYLSLSRALALLIVLALLVSISRTSVFGVSVGLSSLESKDTRQDTL